MASESDSNRGLYGKFHVRRLDGKSEPGQKHEGCEYFVLDVTHDKHAHPALLAYAESCEADFPLLARDLRVMARPASIVRIESVSVTGRQLNRSGCPRSA